MIILFQGFCVFLLIQGALSLWEVSPAVPGFISLLAVLASLFWADKVISLFFTPRKLSDEEEKQKTRIGAILDSFNPPAGYGLALITDRIPLILSYSGLFSKPTIALSTGLAEILTEEQLKFILAREVRHISGGHLPLFTGASFMPSAVKIVRWWLAETARQSGFGGRPGTSALGSAILGVFADILEFPLLPMARSLHQKADAFGAQTEKNPDLPREAVGRIALEFIRPVIDAPHFRKRVYQAMDVFFPYSIERWTMLKSWQQFSGGLLIDKDLPELAVALEEKNIFFREKSQLQNHYPISRRFPMPGKIKDPAVTAETDILCRDASGDLFYRRLPYFLFFFGILISALMRGYFGIPLILSSLGILIQRNDRARKEKVALSLKGGPNFPVILQGVTKAFKIPGELEDGYFYLQTDKRTIPIILRQLFRSEDPLFSLSEMQVEVRGVIQVEEIPYLEISTISGLEKQKKIILRSARSIIIFLGAAGLFIAGLLLLIIEKFPLRQISGM